LAAFAIFCLLASSVYVFNDLCDLSADREHEKKRTRPLPSGRVSVPVAIACGVALLAGAIALTVVAKMPVPFIAVVASYLLINLAYSLGLKQVALLELFFVSSGFVLRLLAGGIAIGVELSPWILVATGCLAMLMTVGKRRGDIAQENDKKARRASLAGYNLAYLDGVLSMLTSVTLVVYLLFCISDYATQRFGQFVLLTAAPVAYGVLRYVQLIKVYGAGEAPTDLVIKDRPLMATLVIFVAIFAMLIYL
jgi:decaprenyl-phosphate phosphoribosyltransferase